MKYNALWNQLLPHLSAHLNQDIVDKWLKNLTISSMQKDYITFVAPNKFIKSWVEDNYLPIIKKVFKDHLTIVADIMVVTNTKDNSVVKEVPVTQAESESSFRPFGMTLDKNYSFESFVSGESNKFAYSACKMASKGDTKFNPLFIYGDVGLGKTHLMQAVGNELSVKFPKLKILYTTGETFVNEYVKSLRDAKIDDFKDRYRNVDILLFDDVQLIAGKEKTMDEFFYTFNQLYATQKQIVLTSNTPPADIKELDKRLSTRFASGLMVDIKIPSIEEKEAIIEKKVESFPDTPMPKEVIKYVAKNIKSESVRDLIGAVIRLNTYSHISNEPITIEFTSKILKDYLSIRDKALSPDDIVTLTSTYFQMKPSDLKSKNRSKNLSYARSIAMYLLREKTQLSLTDIGTYFSRDHTTALHAINKIAEQLKKDNELKGTIDNLLKKMKFNS